MTQKISPAVFSSAARMASAMRRLSTSEIITSPAPRGAAAAERAAPAGEAAAPRDRAPPAGEAAAPREAAGPGRARRSPRTRDRNEDRSACAPSRSCAGLSVSAASAGDTADNHEENENKE